MAEKGIVGFISSLFKPVAQGAGAVGAIGTGAYFGVPAAFNWAAEKVSETLGIDPKLALPAVATAAAGVIGGLLGNGKIAGLAMAVTGAGFALNHLNGPETALAHTANPTGPEPRS